MRLTLKAYLGLNLPVKSCLETWVGFTTEVTLQLLSFDVRYYSADKLAVAAVSGKPEEPYPLPAS